MAKAGRYLKQKQRRERKYEHRKETLLESLGLPQDVLCGETLLSVVGNRKLRIENYRSILIYTDTLIRIQTKPYKLTVSGKNLSIRSYDKDEMEIVGHLDSVVFE